MDISDKILFFKIEYIDLLKIITEILDKMVSEVTWTFTSHNPTNNSEEFVGLEMGCTDPSRTVYFKTKLGKEIFKLYHCREYIYELGIGLENLNKILKFVDKSDTSLYFYVEENDTQNLVIKFRNKEKKNKRIYRLPLININSQKIPQKKMEFDKKIIIPGEEFHKVCKEMNSIAEYIEIICSSKSLTFNCKGDCQGTNVYKTGEDEIEIITENKKGEKVIKGIYELKNIVSFAKLTNISDEFSIYMKNNFALTIVYSIESLGNITIVFSPVQEDTIKNVSYPYSDDEDELDMIKNNDNVLEDN